MRLFRPRIRFWLRHPHLKKRWVLASTIAIFLIALPILIIISIVYQGYELVPSLQSTFEPNTSIASWWTSDRLPHMLPTKNGPCEPKDLGRGDTFRLTASLFDYTVMSTWNTTEGPSPSKVQDQQRVEYRGESFANCSVNGAQFDFSMQDITQTVTVGVICPGTPEYPVYISMETKMVFAWLLSKDFVGQYYGPGLNLLNVEDADPNDYRRLAFAVLETISTDSLTIMRRQFLSSPVLAISSYYDIFWTDGIINPNTSSNSLTYLNGSDTSWPAEADIYIQSIFNLVNVAVHTVNLDLGSAGSESIYKNRAVLNKTIGENLAPPGITPFRWAENSQSFYYGGVPAPYQTWAQTLRAGHTIALGEVTGLPNGSSMVTSYLCPSYQMKPIRSFLTSIFIAMHTMLHSMWIVWIVFLAYLAERIRPPPPPCLGCTCDNCKPKPTCQNCTCAKCESRRTGDDEQNVGTDSGEGGDRGDMDDKKAEAKDITKEALSGVPQLYSDASAIIHEL